MLYEGYYAGRGCYMRVTMQEGVMLYEGYYAEGVVLYEEYYAEEVVLYEG